MITEHITTTVHCDEPDCRRYIATDTDLEPFEVERIATAAGWHVALDRRGLCVLHHCPAHEDDHIERTRDTDADE